MWVGTSSVFTAWWQVFGLCPRGVVENPAACTCGAHQPSPLLSRPCAHPQVSKASSELMSYCEQHARSDPLVVGVPASENPFKDKKPCVIL